MDAPGCKLSYSENAGIGSAATIGILTGVLLALGAFGVSVSWPRLVVTLLFLGVHGLVVNMTLVEDHRFTDAEWVAYAVLLVLTAAHLAQLLAAGGVTPMPATDVVAVAAPR